MVFSISQCFLKRDSEANKGRGAEEGEREREAASGRGARSSRLLRLFSYIYHLQNVFILIRALEVLGEL